MQIKTLLNYPIQATTGFTLLNKDQAKVRFPYGNRYDQELQITDIATLMRADIKQAKKEGLLPQGLKTSVRCKFYSGGCSIDIRVTDCGGVEFVNPYHIKYTRQFHDQLPSFLQPAHPGKKRFTQEGEAILHVLKAIHGQYNFDKSEMETDYFHVNYYGDVAFDAALEMDTRRQIKAAIQAGDYCRFIFTTATDWAETQA